MSPTLPRILLTGFDPFGGESINPSWEAVRSLHGRRIGGHLIVARQLPTSFAGSLRELKAAVREVAPTILLGVNQTIMMALAMVTYASMIGVGGLGRLVLQGIGRLDMGLATVGGLGIAALAILCSTLFATRPRERRGPAWAASPYALLKTMFGQVTPRGDARLPQRR